jgi:hypothetical protein
MGTFLLLKIQAITHDLYIARMHTAVHMSQAKQKGKIHIVASNCKSHKEKVGDQSVDYAATHVGKSIPRRSLQLYTDLSRFSIR